LAWNPLYQKNQVELFSPDEFAALTFSPSGYFIKKFPHLPLMLQQNITNVMNLKSFFQTGVVILYNNGLEQLSIFASTKTSLLHL
jgi:hypothetical protein